MNSTIPAWSAFVFIIIGGIFAIAAIITIASCMVAKEPPRPELDEYLKH